jgi:ADP-ribose pyrophosphatase
MEIYHGKRLTVERNSFSLPNGKEVERLVVHPGDAVAVLPVRKDGRYYLIRQYRFAIGEYIYEVPAGTVDPEEAPLDTARRELIEETGMSAEHFVPRGFIYTTPGFSDERIYLYEANGLSPSSSFLADEDEVIEVVSFSGTELEEMIADGRISDAKTICLVHRSIQRNR